MSALDGNDGRPARAHITAREREILGFVGGGLTTSQIAARLALAPSTIDSTVDSAKHKLGARTRRQAAAIVNDTRAWTNAVLDPDQCRLLVLLGAGHSVRDAARSVHMSERTAHRRLQAARAALGVATNSEALRSLGFGSGPTADS